MRGQELGAWVDRVANRLRDFGYTNEKSEDRHRVDEHLVEKKDEQVFELLLGLEEASELKEAIVLTENEDHCEVAKANLVDAERCQSLELTLVLVSEALRYSNKEDVDLIKKAFRLRARTMAKLAKYDKAIEDIKLLQEFMEKETDVEMEALLQHCQLRLQGSQDSAEDIESRLAVSSETVMSNCLEVVESSDQYGTYLRATRKIETGERLVVEKPIVSYSMKEENTFDDDICHHCLKVIETGCFLPCFKCSLAIFCCLQCRSTAMKSYHKYECRLQNLFRSTGLSRLTLLMLAFRLVCQHYSQMSLVDKMSEGYKRIMMGLVTHSEQRDVEKDLNVKRAFALLLTVCLNKCGFMDNNEDTKKKKKKKTKDTNSLLEDDESHKEREVGVMRALLRCIEAFEFNAHMVEAMLGNRVLSWDSETRLWKSVSKIHLGEVVETSRLGGGIYPILSHINHSCDPNVMVINVQGHLAVAIAARNIEKGEQIFDTYGPVYHHMAKEERQEALKKTHWFECQCEACMNNFGDFQTLPRDYLRLGGEHFVSKRCDRKALQREVERSRKRVDRLLREQHLQKATEELKHWNNLLVNIIKPPHRDFVTVRRALRNCFWLRSGNCVEAREDEEIRKQREAARATWINTK